MCILKTKSSDIGKCLCHDRLNDGTVYYRQNQINPEPFKFNERFIVKDKKKIYPYLCRRKFKQNTSDLV